MFLAGAGNVSGQTTIDSLKQVLTGLSDSEEKVDVLNQLGNLNCRKAPELAQYYCDQALALAETLAYDKGQVQALQTKAYAAYMKNDQDVALEHLKAALDLARMSYNHDGILYSLRFISSICQSKEDYACAVDKLKESIKLGKSLKNDAEVARDYVRLGHVYKSLSDYAEALSYYRRSLDIMLKAGEQDKTIAGLYNTMGLMYRKKGEYHNALDYYLRSLKVKEGLNDEQFMQSTLNNIGATYWYLKDYDEALNYYQRSKDIALKYKDDFEVAERSHNIANIYAVQGKHDEAMMTYLEALAIFEGRNDQSNIATVLASIGELYLNQQNADKALEYFNKSLAIRDKLSLGEEVASSYNDLAKAYLAAGDAEQSIDYSNKALDLADSIGALAILEPAYKNLSDAYTKTGNVEQAFGYYKKHEHIKDSLSNYQTSKAITQLVTEYKSATTGERGAGVVAEEKPFSTDEGKYYALIIAVQDYDSGSGVLDLQFPIQDAQNLMNVLTTDYIFEKENVTFLQNPTMYEMTTVLEKLSDLLTDKDNLLVFYSGHGHWDEKFQQGYWLPKDAKDGYRQSWLANDHLQSYIRAINTRHTLVVADACFSGSLFTMSREAFANASKSVKYKYKLPSRKAITSGSLETVPDQSVFIRYLLKKLDNNEEDFMAAGELFYQIQESISNNSNNLPQYGVIHETGDEGGDFIFVRRQ